MDILNAIESALKAELDELAFRINSRLKDQTAEDSIEKLRDLINRYTVSLAQIDVVGRMKSQSAPPEGTPPAPPENETPNEG